MITLLHILQYYIVLYIYYIILYEYYIINSKVTKKRGLEGLIRPVPAAARTPYGCINRIIQVNA